jgi:DNA gyrase subunit B
LEARLIQTPSSYAAKDIQVLEGLEAVRRRPGMYVGGTDIKALHHLVYEVVDNSIDEALAGYCDRITITIHADSSLTVEDNGRGIPVDIHPEKNKSALEVVMTTLHAGGKFGGGGYKVSGGLHGVGVSAVNALSEWTEVEVCKDEQVYYQRYERGIPLEAVRPVRSCSDSESGTRTTFRYDLDIFKSGEDFKFDTLAQRFREMAFVTRKVQIRLVDERTNHQATFYFEGGITSFVRYLNRNRAGLHPVMHVEKEIETIGIEVAIQYTDAFSETVYSFANTINTVDGGTHMTGLRTALTRVINDYARRNNLLKTDDPNFSGDDTREGLTAIVSVKVPEPQFESQTKVKLMNPEVQTYVTQVIGEAFSQFMEENPTAARAIIGKCLTSARARDAARKARDLVIRKSALESMTLPGKLADCSERDNARTEIFIVEGDSAGGCLAGDTRIALASGVHKTIRELANDWALGIQHFGFASNDEGDIRIVPLIEPRLTKQQARLVAVQLSNGERVVCTPDHPFRLRDGSYRPAQELEPGDSLMPFKTRLTGEEELPAPGYAMVWMNGHGEWHHTHHLADLYNLVTKRYTRKAGNVRHHKDFNKRNNDPRNIERMFWRAHTQLHAEHASETIGKMWQDPAFRERKLKQLHEQAILQWQDPEYRRYMSERVKLQRQNDTLNQKLIDGFKAWFASLSLEEYNAYCLKMQELQAVYWSEPEHRIQQSERTRQYYQDHPEAREQRREESLLQWENEELRAWRSEKTREQWADETYSAAHSERVRIWWQEHPEHSEKIVAARKRDWQDEQKRNRIRQALSGWRAETSTEEKGALIRNGHQTKALLLLNRVICTDEMVDCVEQAYEALRHELAPTALSYQRLLQERFSGDEQKLLEAARNVNCKVEAVHVVTETADVYDITVDRYHNFALESGVFVHNSAKQGRDRHFQAILPLRGKILNTERARLDKILSNNEVKALISALGTGVGDGFNVANLRYNKVVIMTDADVDGAHIRTLLLTFFFRYMQPLIEAGHLYIAQPPLYRLAYKNEERYVFSDAEKDAFIKELGVPADKVGIQRYKGLGEMNPQQLWETTMHPEKRVMLQVGIDDAASADRTFDMLMGAAVPPRTRFIQTHAREVENLDI